MRGVFKAALGLLTWLLLLFPSPASAVVIEDIVANHPLVSLVNSWSQPLSGESLVSQPPAQTAGVTTNDVTVAPDNMTVEVLPVRLPSIPPAVVFLIYLVGALVFYTLLVLVAQPSPMEYQ